MREPETGNRGAGDTRVAALTPPPAHAAHVSQPGRRRVLGARAGITGLVPAAAHFTAPALARWPYPGTSPGELIAYPTAHRMLVCGGGWPQATGAQTPTIRQRPRSRGGTRPGSPAGAGRHAAAAGPSPASPAPLPAHVGYGSIT